MTVTAAASASVHIAPALGKEAAVLDGWRLMDAVGEGRWTRVIRARPVRCPDGWPSDYAIKLLKEEYAAAPECVEMLRREALVGSKVSHPHLAAVLDSHVQHPPHYLTLPFLEGVTLSATLAAARPLAVPRALWVGRQAAEALAALHHSGWRHGDVKPDNLHLAPSGHVTLLDLGLAQPLEENSSRRLTAFAGSVAYAAPETFCSAQSATAAGDVYSLGVVLFQALTARLPFEDDNPDRVAAAHLCQPPPDLRSLVPHLPGRVARVVRRMLAKEPLRRPTASECVELLAALEIETFGEGLPYNNYE